MLSNDDKEIIDELRKIQKSQDCWKDNIDFVADKLNEIYSVEVKAKALWVIGEMGLIYPEKVKEYIDVIVGYIEDEHPKLRERSVNADEMEKVRLSFVWACENIATNAPELFCEKLELFKDMFSDPGEKVRIEAPEMFRVVGKRKPECVRPYLEKLEYIAKNDKHPIVRIHSRGAVRITKDALKKDNA